MRLIRTVIDEGDREEVVEVLEKENIDYIILEERSGREGLLVVEFPLPEQALQVVLDRLEAAGHSEHVYTVVAEATSALSENIGEMEDRFVVGDEADSSIATAELRSQALGILPDAFTYYLLTFLSAVVATAGILLDSPALVVGSMVIAPLVGSAVTASVGAVLANRDMILKGAKTQVYGLGIATLGAVAFAAVLKTGTFYPPSWSPASADQIAHRMSPGLLSLIIGVSAGAAGAAAISTGISTAVVGVMIAAALIPAAAVIGIGIVWAEPAIAYGAFLLLIVNAASIQVSAVAVFWYLGYRPERWQVGNHRANLSIRKFGPSLVVALVLFTVFITAGGVITTHVNAERSANIAVEEVLKEEQYDELELESVQSQFSAEPLFAEPREVTVTVRGPADQTYPELSKRFRDKIEAKTGRAPAIQVEFVRNQRSPSPSSGEQSEARDSPPEAVAATPASYSMHPSTSRPDASIGPPSPQASH